MRYQRLLLAVAALATSSAALAANRGNVSPGNGSFVPWEACQVRSNALAALSPTRYMYPYHHCTPEW